MVGIYIPQSCHAILIIILKKHITQVSSRSSPGGHLLPRGRSRIFSRGRGRGNGGCNLLNPPSGSAPATYTGLLTGCATAQFGQTCTIMHNSQNPAKSRTILKDLLKNLIKSGILLITKIPKNFLGYFPTIYLLKQSRNRFPRSLKQI